MKPLKHNLFRQLLSIAIIMVGVVFISLGVIVPKALIPIYEKSIYQQLKQPLELVNPNLDDNEILANVAYLYITSNNKIITSVNISQIINIQPKQILDKIDQEYGKFTHLGKTYYYHTSVSNNIYKIALTNNNYIIQMRQEIIYKIFPIILITILIITISVILWARSLVLKIEYLKNKVDNLDNDEFPSDNKYIVSTDDELHALSIAIDNMKIALKEQEEFKNLMYQNISHDFKTPLTVIKSYLEAIDDGIETKESASKVIRDQIFKLESKVHSLLYLNKLNYIKEKKHYQEETTDISKIITSSIEKFKIQRPDVNWKLVIGDKKTIFKGTHDMWETIIDNLLNNFIRYADKHIKITIKKGKINLYNDGPNINENILNDLFTPYKKGINGQFGLGLSIVKKTLSLFGYEIIIYNEKKGVNFVIR